MQLRIIRLVFLQLLFCSCFLTTAQQISGSVSDANAKAPIYYAHIVCPETGEATVTDERGNFTLILKASKKSRTIRASFVGYKTGITNLNPGIRTYNFELLNDTTYLKEIVIDPVDPLELIRASLKKLDENHGGKRLLSCFYRMVSKNQDKYIQISESAFELNQFPGQYNQLRILRAREAEDEKAFNGVGMGIGTQVVAVKNMDITLNPEKTFLSRENLRKHDFFYEGVTRRGDVEVHEISFDQKKVKEALFKGKIFLHTGSLAFVGIEFKLSEVGISHTKVGNAAERAALKLLNIDIDVLGQSTVISYRPYGGKWYLDYVLKEEDVRVKSKRYNFDVPVKDRSEFLVTTIDTSQTVQFVPENHDPKDFLESGPDTTAAFWENYNVIPTQINYDAIARQIEFRNGYSLLKENLKAKLKDFPKDPGIRADSVLNYYNKKGLFNGTALIKYKDEIILHKGYGYADKELLIKNDTSTIFRIGSIAKTYTSYLITQMQMEGTLKYEDTIQQFIPWYPYPGITIHHLLTHSSGIPNYTNNAEFLDSIQHPFSIEHLIRKFGLEIPVFKPGADFQYSNTNYTLLALIAEKASGKNFSELFREKITVPIMLNHTTFGLQNNPLQAKGYWSGVAEPTYAIVNTAGAGAIASTASDLSKWDQHLKDSRFDILFKPRTWYHDWGSYYGYGWNIDKYQFSISKKHTVYYHGGTDFGFKSMMARQPDKENLIVLLNNTGEFPLFDITDILFSVLN